MKSVASYIQVAEFDCRTSFLQIYKLTPAEKFDFSEKSNFWETSTILLIHNQLVLHLPIDF